MTNVSWSRLIRFTPSSDPNTIFYGEPLGDANALDDIGNLAEAGRLEAAIIEVDGSGPLSDSAKVTKRIEKVGRLLGPLGIEHCTDIKCIGLNYRKHSMSPTDRSLLCRANSFSPPIHRKACLAGWSTDKVCTVQEAGRSLPPFPSLFIKPTTSLADYNESVPIPRCAQEDEADYEGELCAIIGKDCKDVSVEEALDYVVGYTAGDDVSTRKWQRSKERAGGVPQWCFSKVKGFHASFSERRDWKQILTWEIGV